MTAMAPDTERPPATPACGCCGRQMLADRLTELGSTPGVFICARCAVWAARRSTRFPVVRLDPRLLTRWLRGRRPTSAAPVGMAIPVLYSTDLDRTADYYGWLGLKVVGRHHTYLAMQAGPVELHFTTQQLTPPPGQVWAPGQVFLHAHDAVRLWKQFQHRGVEGIGPPEELPHGLTEFVVTDPDGNRIRIGSPTPKE